jgi:hypothetical protein
MADYLPQPPLRRLGALAWKLKYAHRAGFTDVDLLNDSI